MSAIDVSALKRVVLPAIKSRALFAVIRPLGGVNDCLLPRSLMPLFIATRFTFVIR